MNTLLMNFDESIDINKIYIDLKRLYPAIDIIKNPGKSDIDRLRRNAEYLEMLDKAEKDIADGKGIIISKEQLEMWANE